ncbi:PREDICTED: uncharacterized protein LOC104816757 [Tarenaya hassleriana]|uniref:uncharacterized protein LOC104816757 n=1 Tax=Tarenaya hassleriana TaxID=28532 RepID=UPI00053C6A38|nr:PREDICTED: uncharacterized protein LOC104816757 [Tarenaya hassleriana]
MVSPFGSPCSSPRKSRKDKNPYSSRGLDKFSALLSDLEEKRQKIYAKLGSEEAPLVRFVFKSSGECVPLIIKSSNLEKTPGKTVRDAKIKASVQESKPESESKGSSDGEAKHTEADPDKKTEQKPCVLNVNLQRMKRPSHYLPVTVILVLVFLAFFGRSVAIMCTCIAWYLVPTIRDRSGNKKTAMKKKSFARKLSNESRGSSFNPRTRENAAIKEKFPCLAARGRSS